MRPYIFLSDEQAFGGQVARRRDDDMLVEVDLSSIIADMEDGGRDEVGRHGGVMPSFMDVVSFFFFYGVYRVLVSSVDVVVVVDGCVEGVLNGDTRPAHHLDSPTSPFISSFLFFNLLTVSPVCMAERQRYSTTV